MTPDEIERKFWAVPRDRWAYANVRRIGDQWDATLSCDGYIYHGSGRCDSRHEAMLAAMLVAMRAAGVEE